MNKIASTLTLMTALMASQSYASCTKYIANSETDMASYYRENKFFKLENPVFVIGSAATFITAGVAAGVLTTGVVGTSFTIDQVTELSEEELYTLQVLEGAEGLRKSESSNPQLASFTKLVKKNVTTAVSEDEVAAAIRTVDSSLAACTNEDGDLYHPLKGDLLKAVVYEIEGK